MTSAHLRAVLGLLAAISSGSIVAGGHTGSTGTRATFGCRSERMVLRGVAARGVAGADDAAGKDETIDFIWFSAGWSKRDERPHCPRWPATFAYLARRVFAMSMAFAPNSANILFRFAPPAERFKRADSGVVGDGKDGN